MTFQCWLIAVTDNYEKQGRGSPHMHFLLWQAGLSSDALKKVSDNEQAHARLMNEVNRVVQAHWKDKKNEPTSQMPASAAAATEAEQPKPKSDALWQLSFTAVPNAQPACTCPVAVGDEPEVCAFLQRWVDVVSVTNVHSHALTCRKGTSGKCSCRMAYPVHCFNGQTALRHLFLEGNVVKAYTYDFFFFSFRERLLPSNHYSRARCLMQICVASCCQGTWRVCKRRFNAFAAGSGRLRQRRRNGHI